MKQRIAVLLWIGLLPVPAQEPAAPGGWRKFDQPPPAERGQAPAQPAAVVPSQIVIPSGTWITLRVNEELSSDRSRRGDLFSATLVQPVVADGFVVARRGQTVAGRVVETVKAGKIRGTSRLAIEISEITLADGQQAPVTTQLVEYAGGTTVGRDATTIGTATGLGAAVGAAADGGFGAGVGAAAGAAASTIGVLLTRGRATVIYPESTLTFRTTEAVTVSTERSRHAFAAVRQDDYEPKLERRRSPTLYAPPYYAGGWYPFFYPHWYGTSIWFHSYPRYHHRGGFRRR